MAESITPRASSYADWYIDIVLGAQLADYSPVKGCMVIRPRGYRLWELIQSELDARLKATGHQNAYFPLLIPERFIHQEAEHVEGFAPELAIVTHGGGEKLAEPLVIRPTSETVIWSMYKKWIQSYRDLPILINQWANVLRWEKRTRLFLRTTEFLWQEGHTAHATAEEAEEEAQKIFTLYQDFVRDYMAISLVAGRKSESEKFAGAITTYAVEAMMQDGKALQAGTSHFLGQNFAKAFDVQFQTQNGGREYVWASSWGVSTRLIGALIMAHSDDKGLILPPRLAPTQVVIIPLLHGKNSGEVMQEAKLLYQKLAVDNRVEIDTDEQNTPGWRFSEWECRGVPLRIELGPRDIEKQSAVLVRRDTGEKSFVPLTDLMSVVQNTLEEIQQDLYNKHHNFVQSNSYYPENYTEFCSYFAEQQSVFAYAPWDGNPDTEKQIKEQTKATIRVIDPPIERSIEGQRCICSGEAAQYYALFAKSY